jgi:hypothetical protein
MKKVSYAFKLNYYETQQYLNTVIVHTKSLSIFFIQIQPPIYIAISRLISIKLRKINVHSSQNNGYNLATNYSIFKGLRRIRCLIHSL